MTAPINSTSGRPEYHTPDLATNLGEAILAQPGAEDLVDTGNHTDRSFDSAQAARRLPRNVGKTDQKIRIVGGMSLLAAAPFVPLNLRWKMALAAAGAALVTSGSARYCPVWHATNVDTNG